MQQGREHWLHIRAEFGRRDPDMQFVANAATLLMRSADPIGLLGSGPEQAQATGADGALLVDRPKAMGMIPLAAVIAGPLPNRNRRTLSIRAERAGLTSP
jgi:hypothetical protein